MRADLLLLGANVNVVFLVVSVSEEEATIVRVVLKLAAFESHLFFDLFRVRERLHVEIALLTRGAFVVRQRASAKDAALDAVFVDLAGALARGTVLASRTAII